MARNAAIIYLYGLLAETQPILCSISFNFDVNFKETRRERGFEPVASGGQKGDILLFLVLIWLLVVENITTTI